jgi:hypothetical protein
MTDVRNELLLSALRRATTPLTSGDVLDAAVGLAEAEGWTPEQLASLSRKAVSKRLQNMVDAGVVALASQYFDPVSRRLTPTYTAAVRNPNAVVPPPPSVAPRAAAKESPYDGLEKSQLIALLDVHDSLAQCLSRHMQELDSWREKSRQRLLAVGLGEH